MMNTMGGTKLSNRLQRSISRAITLTNFTVSVLILHSLAYTQSSKEFAYDAGLHQLNVPSINGYIQVDGVKYSNLAAATAAVPTDGRSSIFDALSESDSTTNPMTVNPFPNDRAVDVRLGGGVIINTNVPLVLGNGSTLAGSGRIILSLGLGSGTLIAPGSSFPVAMTQPAAPTLTCHSTGGHLVNGTYRVTLTQVNNVNTYTPAGGSRAATPGETIGAANEQSIACSGGGSSQSITFTTPAQQKPGGSTTFEPLGTKIYMTATNGASGTETFDDASTSNVSCTQSTTFPTACADSTSVTILNFQAPGNPPPNFNTTNPLVVLGDVGPYSGGNEFGIRVATLG